MTKSFHQRLVLEDEDRIRFLKLEKYLEDNFGLYLRLINSMAVDDSFIIFQYFDESPFEGVHFLKEWEEIYEIVNRAIKYYKPELWTRNLT